MAWQQYFKSSNFMLNPETTTHHEHGCKFTRGEVRAGGHPLVPSEGQTTVAYGWRKCHLSPSTKMKNYWDTEKIKRNAECKIMCWNDEKLFPSSMTANWANTAVKKKSMQWFTLKHVACYCKFFTLFLPLQHLQPPVFLLPPSSPLRSVPVSDVDEDILLLPWTGSEEPKLHPPMHQWQQQ